MDKTINLNGSDAKGVGFDGIVLSGTYANAMTDFMFKRLFGCKQIMLPFLNEILPDIGITDLSYIGTENIGEEQDDRRAVFDLSCSTNSGEEIIIEMQLAGQKYFRQRSIAYTAYPLVRQARLAREKALSEGKEFRWDFHLHPIYFVGILNFSLEHEKEWPDGKYISDFTLKEHETGERMSDTLRYVFLELGRFFKREQECSSLIDMIAYSMKMMHQFNDIPSSFDDDVIKYFYKLSEILNFTDEEKDTYKKSLNMNWDWKNMEDFAHEKGVAQGRAEVAEKLLQMGMPVEKVSEATGISVESLSDLM